MENKRVIIKLSGESLFDSSKNQIFDKEKLDKIISFLKELYFDKVKIGLVIGAGNIFRGRVSGTIGLNNEEGDYLGMVGTVINCKAISYLLSKNNIKNTIYSALEVQDVAQKYNKELAKKDYDEGKVVIFAGGVGKVNHTTDTCASLRAIEMNASMILSGKNGVDGIYDKDPNKFNDAKFIKDITYSECKKKMLKVIDMEAIDLLIDKKIETRIFSMDDLSNFKKVISGDYNIGSTIHN